jgi:GH25 family lysozyme M1 (1,4-beta-N-acetylmuramidase)
MEKAIGVDVSYYQQIIDWNQVEVDFAIIRCLYGNYEIDPKFIEHFDGANNKVPVVGVYVWWDATLNPQKQAAKTLEILADRKPDFIAIDAEQWWSDWNKWREWRRGDITRDEVPRFSDGQLSSSLKMLFTKLAESGIPIIIYTSKGFIDSYMPSITTWLKDKILWLAQYLTVVQKFDVKKAATWKDFKTNVLPLLSENPAVPNGMDKTYWHIWQITGDHFTLPGMWSTVYKNRLSGTDVNIFNGTLDDMKKLFKVNNVITTPPTEEVNVVTLDEWAKEVDSFLRDRLNYAGSKLK